MRKFLRIWKDAEIDPDGVTPVWRWQCEHYECLYRTADHGVALFWENAIRGANHHIKWHQMRRPNAKV